MAFTLKKIISMFLMPLSLGLILFVVGLFYLYRQSYSKAKFYLTVSFLWIVLISSSFVSDALLKPLENQYQTIDLKNQSAEYILLLGGDFQSRSYEAIRLHHQIHNSKIITSGYPGLHKTVSEAVINAQKLMDIGIKKENILIQTQPRDTQEEAQHIKKLIGLKPFILVTSAYHMPRAMHLFQQEGLNPIPAPTNFLVDEESVSLRLPNGSELKKTEIAQHEYLGMWWIKLKKLLE